MNLIQIQGNLNIFEINFNQTMVKSSHIKRSKTKTVASRRSLKKFSKYAQILFSQWKVNENARILNQKQAKLTNKNLTTNNDVNKY